MRFVALRCGSLGFVALHCGAVRCGAMRCGAVRRGGRVECGKKDGSAVDDERAAAVRSRSASAPERNPHAKLTTRARKITARVSLAPRPWQSRSSPRTPHANLTTRARKITARVSLAPRPWQSRSSPYRRWCGWYEHPAVRSEITLLTSRFSRKTCCVLKHTWMNSSTIPSRHT